MTAAELAQNPFWVLEVAPAATRAEVERAGQRLLGLLAIGAAAARRYTTPFGAQERDEATVRSALATLRDPEQRVLWELWLGDAGDAEGDAGGGSAALPGWAQAALSIGWRGP